MLNRLVPRCSQWPSQPQPLLIASGCSLSGTLCGVLRPLKLLQRHRTAHNCLDSIEPTLTAIDQANYRSAGGILAVKANSGVRDCLRWPLFRALWGWGLNLKAVVWELILSGKGKLFQGTVRAFALTWCLGIWSRHECGLKLCAPSAASLPRFKCPTK